MDSAPEGLNLTEEERNRLKRAAVLIRDAAKKSAETRHDFHNQLAVLSAGSIAVMASGTVAMLSWSAAHPQIPTRPFFLTIIIASIALWMALFCCISHNYLETVIQERESASGFDMTFIRFAEISVQRSSVETAVSKLQTAKAKSEKKTRLTLKLKKTQLCVSAFAVLLFTGGYFALIVLIWTEAKLL